MPFLLAEPSGLNNHIVTCEYLYPVSGHEERIWTAEDLRPHLFYLHQGKMVDRFFGGVLFEALKSEKGEILSGKALGMGMENSEQGWEEALNALFKTEGNLSALLELSKENVQPKRIDLWIALPYPYPSSARRSWPGGRAGILLSWIDQFLYRWEEIRKRFPGHSVDFKGFAWTKSSLDLGDEELISLLATKLHPLGWKLMWQQNYGTAKAMEGRKMGFDYILIRPTHLGDPPEGPRGEKWIAASAAWANFQEFGLILWGDERVSNAQIIDYLNAGRDSFMHAFQFYELGARGILPYYQRGDPIYVYLYAYTKGAYANIPVLARD
ncbi:hypothetical protein CULT_500038 [[Clostridium] ultunense Esp]|nr:hypothetical protein CULT_500038 [[Clostridium] ultunense Esp]